MSWPPLKAWTSSLPIANQVYFVAINYGGKKNSRWVVLMSVLDSGVVVKVPWPTLVNASNWKSGWVDNCFFDSSVSDIEKHQIEIVNDRNLSVDSGLTMPITKNMIRPWFSNH